MKHKRILSLFLILSFILILISGCRTVKDTESQISSESYTSSVNSEITDSSKEETVSSEITSSTENSASSNIISSTPPLASKPVAAKPAPQVKPQAKPPQVTSTNKTEMRAVWISFLEYEKILKEKTEKQFTNNITEYFNNCVNNGFNTVIVQVRSHSDAYYKSKYYPASINFTGKRQNTFPFDPLKIMVDKAHERGLKIEAWINPYRGSQKVWSFAENDPVNERLGSDLAFTFGDYHYLNPGEPEVQQFILNGILEVVENYNIDGIHFDDYFYPTADPSIDVNTYQKYGNGKTLKEFRTDSVNKLVSTVYREIKKRKNITFGISPEGNIDNCIQRASADVKLWGSTEGYVDYIAPQLYWDYGQGTLPYDVALEKWTKVVTNKKVKLIVGLAAYGVADEDNEFWKSGDVLKRQVIDARKTSNYGGFIVFRYKYLFSPELKTELNNLKSILK